MIDHETHLKNVLEAQKELAKELNELSNMMAAKKEQFAKYQGIVEYLTGNGITLEEEEVSEPAE